MSRGHWAELYETHSDISELNLMWNKVTVIFITKCMKQSPSR